MEKTLKKIQALCAEDIENRSCLCIASDKEGVLTLIVGNKQKIGSNLCQVLVEGKCEIKTQILEFMLPAIIARKTMQYKFLPGARQYILTYLVKWLLY